ncbi:MAG: arginase family protein [Nanoarchaeota archaeon]|nr:arginase family protein [Nanoarchaeota archaeon]
MIVTIPYSDGEHQSCEKAPEIIIEELKKIWNIRLPLIKENSINNIESAKVYIGGDHTITYYTVKHFVKNYSNPGFVVFDAHPDVFQAFETPSHQDYLKFLIEENILKPENVIAIGIRAPHKAEIAYYKEKGIQYIPCWNILDAESICDGVMEFLRKFDGFYISIDLDVLDPAYAPGVSYIEPSGFTTRELLYFIQRFKKLPNQKCLDIVEYNPDNDNNNITAKIAAKIIAEFL